MTDIGITILLFHRQESNSEGLSYGSARQSGKYGPGKQLLQLPADALFSGRSDAGTMAAQSRGGFLSFLQ